MRKTVLALVLVFAAAAAGCGSDTTTAPSSTTASTVSEVFVGTLAVRGSSFYSFTVNSAGTVNINLASITAGTPSLPTGASVQVGVGVPRGEVCSLTSSAVLTAALTSQVSNTMNPGVYCVEIRDTGTLAAPVNFAIRIVHP